MPSSIFAPDSLLPTVRRVAELRSIVRGWRAEGRTIGLVPTMGALHEGHLTLVRQALARHDRVIVSLFVNPTQFGPNEDYAAYPRTESADAAKLAAIGAHLLWAPALDEMYQPHFSTRIELDDLTQTLCGPIRPGHFSGVATVVTKLLLQTLPDAAYFGEKDFQQLLVIRRVVRDLDLPVIITGVPTVREADGLALSSRNAYLSPAERAAAALLPMVLGEIAQAAAADLGSFMELIRAARAALAEGGFGPIDYVTIADAETLQPVDRILRPARVFAAVRLGRTRLIDNMPI